MADEAILIEAEGAGDAASITVLICTHNRRQLLERTIASLNAARRPPGCSIEILVVASACGDDTLDYLASYNRERSGRLPIRWISEAARGKSNALNRAFREPMGAVVAFVDDDHRVDSAYLEAVDAAARAYPEAGLFCGRILPDWDGSEPAWVHDGGPYRIYPLPVPRFDLGALPLELTLESPVPGGGNLVARRRTIEITGEFAADRGPIGHDLGGAEDLDWVGRALRAAVRLRYAPEIVQFHYVDVERLSLSYLVRKGYQRSKSVICLDRRRQVVPRYMWRKLLEYAAKAAFSFDVARRRFFIVRMAAALGEISGIAENVAKQRSRSALSRLPQDVLLGLLLAGAITAFTLAAWLTGDAVAAAILPVGGVALVSTLALVVKSIRDFSKRVPGVRDEILGRFRAYLLYAFARLAFWMWAIFAFFAAAGVIVYGTIAAALPAPFDPLWATVAAAAAIALATAVQGGRKLRDNPGLLIASWQYRLSRLHRWRDLLTNKALTAFHGHRDGHHWQRVCARCVGSRSLAAHGARRAPPLPHCVALSLRPFGRDGRPSLLFAVPNA